MFSLYCRLFSVLVIRKQKSRKKSKDTKLPIGNLVSLSRAEHEKIMFNRSRKINPLLL
jgi:hypothetical protein